MSWAKSGAMRGVSDGAVAPQNRNQGWPNHGTAAVTTRLTKAKSSPNVSKPPPIPGQRLAKMENGKKKLGERYGSATAVRSPLIGLKPTLKTTPPCRDDAPSENATTSGGGRSASGKYRLSAPPIAASAEPKKRGKDATASSCKILEDRALLKKGLSRDVTPEKWAGRPEVIGNKTKCLSRSASLWSVSGVASGNSDFGGKGVFRTTSGSSAELKKDSRSSRGTSGGLRTTSGGNLNRTTSLWNVQTEANTARMFRARSVSGLRPSRIPLLTQHHSASGAGPQTSNFAQSLADLTSVDRYGEKLRPRIIVFGHDQIDNPRICDLETASRRTSQPIYENLKEITPPKSYGTSSSVVKTPEKYRKVQVSRTKSSLSTSSTSSSTAPEIRTSYDLEKRAAELMAELDDDDDDLDDDENEDDDPMAEEPPRAVADDPRIPSVPVPNAEKTLAISAISAPKVTLKDANRLERVRGIAKSQENLNSRREPEMSIKEIRRNWEQQIKRSQDLQPEVRDKNTVGTGRINSATVNLTKSKEASGPLAEPPNCVKRIKVNKDVVHLVNFFNCKNSAEATPKRDPAGIQEVWPKYKDQHSGIIDSATNLNDPPNLKVKLKVKEEKSNGYVSDDNCSEDSGHMSNENEVEWKEDSSSSSSSSAAVHRRNRRQEPVQQQEELKNLEKNELFLKDIIRDLDTSLERSIGAFVAATDEPKNGRKIRVKASSGVSTSSGASSIDSWDEAAKDRDKRSPKTKLDGEQIFFRSGALERLESHRDEKLTGHIILLQARCRGYLARRKLNTLKLQDLAVRCIQRNVRKLMSVQEWPWWRLYVKVAPLLNVHRTEDQLKARTEELEVLRAKVERLEQERNHLKHDNDRLEAKLSVMSADFAEEHSTSTLAAERIDAETSERLRLERELQDVTEANKNLQQTSERLEMELLYARAADLNGLTSDLEDGDDAGGVYKQRYEHALRELEFTKRKMAQQHEDDLEQLVGLKKQLEKKLADAYEEVEEQRQVVGQWKRRVQKLNGEMHDLRLLLEEQTARNNLLEKKQRKFDAETQNLMDDLRQEKTQRERLAREKEIAIAEKFTVEQNLSDARLEIELQEERLHTLGQELEELTFGGKTEEEVAQLKKCKHELEKKVKDQEEELDDLAGQVHLLEQAKLRLEMSIEQQRKEMRKEMQQRDEELEDCRGNAHKKVKALEAQLENEHEERTILLREKHELERRLVSFEEQDRTDRAAEIETTQRLKRDLKRTRALLRDAQTMLERAKGDASGKAALRQLKNQVEDAECARAVAVKAKQALELELNECQAALEEASRSRFEAEERANVANREKTELGSQLEENEEELAEVLKKYRASVQQVSAEQSQLQEAQVQIAALEAEKSSLKEQLSELSQRLESVEQLGDPTANSLATRRLEFRAKELESKLELEQTTRARLETQIARLKESVDKLQTETALLRTKEQTAQDAARRLQRSLRELRDESSSASAREQEATRARRDLEKALESAEAETKVARDDLRLALQRIDDLQSAIQGELDLDCSEEATSENSDSD